VRLSIPDPLPPQPERSPMEKQAKRVYDALCEAQRYASHLYEHQSDVAQQGSIASTELAIERAFECIVDLMHVEDGE